MATPLSLRWKSGSGRFTVLAPVPALELHWLSLLARTPCFTCCVLVCSETSPHGAPRPLPPKLSLALTRGVPGSVSFLLLVIFPQNEAFSFEDELMPICPRLIPDLFCSCPHAVIFAAPTTSSLGGFPSPHRMLSDLLVQVSAQGVAVSFWE